MTPSTHKTIEKLQATADDELTDFGKTKASEYATKIWNDNNLTREMVVSIACRLLLMD